MHTFTALYATRPEAEVVKADLMSLGVIEKDGIRIGDHSTDGFSPDRNGDSRGFWDSFKDMFISHDDRPVYEESVRQGGFLLIANVPAEHEGRVYDILERSNALNVDEREQHYRSLGTLRQASAVGADPGAAAMRQTARSGSVRARSYIAATGRQDGALKR